MRTIAERSESLIALGLSIREVSFGYMDDVEILGGHPQGHHHSWLETSLIGLREANIREAFFGYMDGEKILGGTSSSTS